MNAQKGVLIVLLLFAMTASFAQNIKSVEKFKFDNFLRGLTIQNTDLKKETHIQLNLRVKLETYAEYREEMALFWDIVMHRQINEKSFAQVVEDAQGSWELVGEGVKFVVPNKNAEKIVAAIATYFLDFSISDQLFLDKRAALARTYEDNAYVSSTLLKKLTQKVVYQGYPLGQMLDVEGIAKMSKADFAQYIKENIFVGRMDIVVESKCKATKSKLLVEKYFKQRPVVLAAINYIKKPQLKPNETYVFISGNVADNRQSVAISYPIRVKKGTDEVQGIRILDEILNNRLTEKGVNTAGGLEKKEYLSLYYRTLMTTPEEAIKHSDICLKEMERMANGGITEEEVAKAKNKLVKINEWDEWKQRTCRYNKIGIEGYEQRYDIEMDRLHAIAKLYLLPKSAYITFLGNEDAIEPIVQVQSPNVLHIDFNGEEKKELTQSGEAITLQTVIDRYIDAIGGREKLQQINTIQETRSLEQRGEIYASVWNKNQLLDDISWKKYTNGEINSSFFYKDQVGQMLYEKQYRTLQGVALDRLLYRGIAFVELDFEKYGLKVVFSGLEVLDDRKVAVIRVRTENGASFKEYYDLKTGLKVQTSEYIKKGESVVIQSTRYDNYRKIGGIYYPEKVTPINGLRKGAVQPLKELIINGKFVWWEE